MALIFCGDFAIPFDTEITVDSRVQDIFKGKKAVVNFEGSILETADECANPRFYDKFSLYSSPESLQTLAGLNTAAVSLLNTHTLDYPYDLRRTAGIIEKSGIKAFGLRNFDETEITDNGTTYRIITFATAGCAHRFPLFSPRHVEKRIREIRREDAGCRNVVFPHWGLELKSLPEPADRHLAHRLIDAGADLIVGHHPHVVQPVEEYNGKTIVYSVGNFILPQVRFGAKTLRFRPASVCDEIVVEYDGITPVIHHLHFDTTANTLQLADTAMTETLDARTSDAGYRKRYIRTVGLSHYLRFARYSDSAAGERGRRLRMNAYYLLRRMLIKCRIYNPYN